MARECYALAPEGSGAMQFLLGGPAGHWRGVADEYGGSEWGSKPLPWGNTRVPKRCSTTSAWKIKFLRVICCG